MASLFTDLVLCSKQGVITFQLNLFSIDKVNRDELWHICETVEPCVIVTKGASPGPESESVLTAQKLSYSVTFSAQRAPCLSKHLLF